MDMCHLSGFGSYIERLRGNYLPIDLNTLAIYPILIGLFHQINWVILDQLKSDCYSWRRLQDLIPNNYFILFIQVFSLFYSNFELHNAPLR